MRFYYFLLMSCLGILNGCYAGAQSDQLHIDLVSAASAGDYEEVERLLEAGADVTYAKPPFFDTALMEAAGKNHKAIVCLLLKAGAPIDARYLHDNGMTALHIAAQNGHVEVVEELLKAGADWGLTDEFRRIAMGFAVEKNRFAVVKSLIRWGIYLSEGQRKKLLKSSEARLSQTCDRDPTIADLCHYSAMKKDAIIKLLGDEDLSSDVISTLILEETPLDHKCRNVRRLLQSVVPACCAYLIVYKFCAEQYVPSDEEGRILSVLPLVRS